MKRAGLFRSAFCLACACVGLWLLASLAQAQSPPYRNRALRWIGTARDCLPSANWSADKLFARAIPGATRLCVYTWHPAIPGTTPTPTEVATLFTSSGATELTEDVPVLLPMSPSHPLSSQEQTFYEGLRAQLRAQVGGASLVPGWPVAAAARVVVIDTAPDSHGDIAEGESRHGDTLARLIQDLVCHRSPNHLATSCAAQITTTLALPWVATGVLGAQGGHVGTLVDLARAIDRAVGQWQADRAATPNSTPPRLILNLSVGWEHNAGVADCFDSPAQQVAPPARGVQAILQYAASEGALIFAAAGNDIGGPNPRAGLICPGSYQGLPRTEAPNLPVLLAVSALDYRDNPLETTRPQGETGLAALGHGGVAWKVGGSVPPALTGSSVSTAVASGVAALVWAVRPSWSATQVSAAVYNGGRATSRSTPYCPTTFAACQVRRANVCGALISAGVPAACDPPMPRLTSSPSLPAELSALTAWFVAPPSTAFFAPPPLANPRYLLPSPQAAPWTFPAPISVTCPTCWVSSSTTGPPQLALPYLTARLLEPMLLLRLDTGQLVGLELGSSLEAATSYRFPLPGAFSIAAAYLTGFDETLQYSITEQLYVYR
jgi:Subtilase family